MSTTTNPPAETAERDDPQPWRSAEDVRAWRVAYRGKGKRRPLAVSVMVDFDAEESEWLSEESQRTGLPYDELIKKFVTRARTRGRTNGKE